MSHKGKKFTPADLAAPRRNRLSKEAQQEWADRQTSRNKIVAIDRGERPDRQAIIAEELAQRTINRLKSPKARRAVSGLLRLSKEDRSETLGAFNADGSLKNPFSPVK